VLSVGFIVWTHRNFCERLPEELLVVEHPTTKDKIRIVPGELRKDHVKVGLHIPPPPEDLPAFLNRFAEGYSSSHLSRLHSF
jgi:hypothetical protein